MSEYTGKLYAIPPGTPARTCNATGCGTAIYLVPVPFGRWLPVEADGTAHWERCPSAAKWRSKQGGTK